MALLAEVDKPGSAIDAYVERLAEVLEHKQKDVETLRDKVNCAFQALFTGRGGAEQSRRVTLRRIHTLNVSVNDV